MKKKFYLFALATMLITVMVNAQTKIKDGTVTGSPKVPTTGALLDLESNNKGLLLPRIQLTNTTTWGLDGTGVAGMTVYNTNATMTGTTAAPTLPGVIGVYFWDGSRWVGASSAAMKLWPYRTNDSLVGVSGNKQGIVAMPGAGLVASGQYSHAEGLNDTATGAFSWAIGENNFVSGSNTFLSGYNNKVSGNWAAVFGASNKDSASYTLVSGQNNIVHNNATHTVLGGQNNKVYGVGNAVFGVDNINSANRSFVIGRGNTLGNAANGSVVGGADNTIEASVGAVFGTRNMSARWSGASIMYGYDNKLISRGEASIIGGYNNEIIDSAGAQAVFGTANKIVAPSNPTLNSSNTIIAGDNNIANTAFSSAIFGRHHVVNTGLTLVAGQGNQITTNMPHATVLGKFNVPDNNALFIIGNGISDTDRNNLFVIRNQNTTGASTNGKVIYSAQLPIYASDAAADADASLPSGGFYKKTGSKAVYQK